MEQKGMMYIFSVLQNLEAFMHMQHVFNFAQILG